MWSSNSGREQQWSAHSVGCTGASAIPAAHVCCWRVPSYTQRRRLRGVGAEHRADALTSVPASQLTLEQVCSVPCQYCNFSSSSVFTASRSQYKSLTSLDSPLKPHDVDWNKTTHPHTPQGKVLACSLWPRWSLSSFAQSFPQPPIKLRMSCQSRRKMLHTSLHPLRAWQVVNRMLNETLITQADKMLLLSRIVVLSL